MSPVIIIVLLATTARSEMHSANYVFGSDGIVNQTGGWNTGIAFLFGLLSVQWTVRAFQSSRFFVVLITFCILDDGEGILFLPLLLFLFVDVLLLVNDRITTRRHISRISIPFQSPSLVSDYQYACSEEVKRAAYAGTALSNIVQPYTNV